MIILPSKPAAPQKAPKLTAEGMQRAILEETLFQDVQEFYRANHAVPEAPDMHITAQGTQVPSLMTQLPTTLISRLHAAVKPLAEAWVKRPIVPTYVYGIRTYQRGAVLKVHRDRHVTHVVSAILNVDQKAEQAWPLLLESEAGSASPWRKVLLAPGELLLYEGNRLLHGRPTPLEGDRYSNCFIHFSLG